MKCPTCGAAKLVHDTRDVPYTYKGETTILPQVTGDFCPACDESVLDATESRRTMDLMLAFNKQVNASIVDPEFIASVRKKLRSTSARLPRFSAAASMRSHAMKMARPSRRWRS